eukprot:gene14183-19034_t
MAIRIPIVCVSLLLGISFITATTTTASNKKSEIIELTAFNVTSTLTDWKYDLAILFYAPWCQYCKQLLPSWEYIATVHNNANKKRPNHKLIVGKLNCESPVSNNDLCVQLSIDRYPSIAFIGYGDFNQGYKGHLLGKGAPKVQSKSSLKTASPNKAMVRFVSDLYPEAVMDWISMLGSISFIHRKWDDLKAFFTGNSVSASRVENLRSKVDSLEYKVQLFGKELEKYKANELFDSLDDLGDAFPMLNGLTPDESNFAFRMCMGDMATEFCKYNSDKEKFCSYMNDTCSQKYMEPEMCRPAQCPFNDKRGCKLMSNCLDKEILAEYIKAYPLTKKTVKN